jgi:hypothetical protein
MDIYGQIKGKIKMISGEQKSIVFTAQVKKVDVDTCTVDLDGLLVSDVRLRAVINNESDHILIVPKINSYVLIADLSGGDFRQLAVIAYAEIESVSIKIGETTLDIDGEGVVFNEGKLNGLVKVDAMVSWMQKVYIDLQTLKSQLSIHPVAGNGAPLAFIFNPATPNPGVSTFANNKIKQ